MEFTYFVSYAWQSRFQNGFGNTALTLGSPIDSFDDIGEMHEYLCEDLKKAIKADNVSVQILFYNLLKKEETSD